MNPLLLSSTCAPSCLLKPAGLPVFPRHHATGSECLLAWWRAQPEYPSDEFPPGFEGGIAHRLDTATSGLVLAANTPTDLTALRRQFSQHTLRKFYFFRSAVGAGGKIAAPITIELPIGHHPKNERKMVVADRPYRRCRGKWYDAWTRFTWLAEDTSCPGTHLWQAEIRTGVMHQIRVHALHAGVALCADPLYSGALGPPVPPEPGELPGFLLHHAQVVFPDGTRTPVAPLAGTLIAALHVMV
ncbi:MAG: RNA pseudouridine synthase [Myxococcales bacterium]|nr:RNA pseudouridine synthase [Myxococcales bacterium]